MRRIVPALMVALVATGTCVAIDDQNPMNPLNPRELRRATASTTEGFRALERGDLSRASELFEDALARVADFPNARVGLGHVAYARRQYEAALSHYTSARDEFVRLHQQALDAEYDKYERLQRKIPELQDDIRALELLTADTVQQRRDLERIIDDMERVRKPVRREPDPPPAEIYYHRGNALFQLGRIAEAVADWETCARHKSGFAPVHNNLAVGLWKLGQIQRALAELAEARALGAKVAPQFEQKLRGAATPPPSEAPGPATH